MAILRSDHAILPDGRRLFAYESVSTISRWTIGSNEAVTVSTSSDLIECLGSIRDRLPFKIVASLAVSPDGDLLAFSLANCVVVWDALTMKRLAVFVDSPMTVCPTHLLFRDEATLIISTVDYGGRSP